MTKKKKSLMKEQSLKGNLEKRGHYQYTANTVLGRYHLVCAETVLDSAQLHGCSPALREEAATSLCYLGGIRKIWIQYEYMM